MELKGRIMRALVNTRYTVPEMSRRFESSPVYVLRVCKSLMDEGSIGRRWYKRPGQGRAAYVYYRSARMMKS